MDRQKVVLGDLHLFAFDRGILRNTSCSCHDLFVLGVSNGQVELFIIAGWTECPSQDFFGVLQDEKAFSILNVITPEELAVLLGLLVVHDVHCTPFEAWR